MKLTLQLQELVERVTALFTIERIYLNSFVYKENSFEELVILMYSSGKLQLIEARPLVAMVMSDYPDYRFRLLYLQDVREALKEGSMVFYTLCREEHLVYQWPGSSYLLTAPDLTAKAVLHRAKRNFEKELKKIAGFRDGLQFYMQRENYPLAALMLHQVMELSYRTAELMVLGKEKISHRLRSHHRLIQEYVWEFSEVFNDQDEQETSLLDLLDGAYQSVRYENSYEITEEQLVFLMGRAEMLAGCLEDLYAVMLAQFSVLKDQR